jgi:iron complex transport system substrate-binding protein
VRPPARITAVLAVAAIGLAACSSSGPDARPSSGSAGGGGFPVKIEHAMGATVVPRPPVRVAALDASYVDAAIALQTQVVAFTSYRSIHGALPAYLGTAGQTYGKGATDVGP